MLWVHLRERPDEPEMTTQSDRPAMLDGSFLTPVLLISKWSQYLLSRANEVQPSSAGAWHHGMFISTDHLGRKLWVGCWLTRVCGAQAAAKPSRGAVSRISMG